MSHDKYQNNRNDIVISNNDNTFRGTDRECDKIIDIQSEKDVQLSNDTGVNIIFRYKFSEEFITELYKFSKIHQYDDRGTYKEAWKNWMEENEADIGCEVRRLNEIGYDGDTIEKMYKSSRYYFRKKSTEKKAPSERRSYVGVSQNLLDSMDKYISESLGTKPATSFNEFCKTNVDILQEEVKRLCIKNISDSDEIKVKIKKTYKNRYFMKINEYK